MTLKEHIHTLTRLNIHWTINQCEKSWFFLSLCNLFCILYVWQVNMYSDKKGSLGVGGTKGLHTFKGVTCSSWTVRLSSSSLTHTIAGWRTLLGSTMSTWKGRKFKLYYPYFIIATWLSFICNGGVKTATQSPLFHAHITAVCVTLKIKMDKAGSQLTDHNFQRSLKFSICYSYCTVQRLSVPSYWAAACGVSGSTGLQKQFHPEVYSVLCRRFHLR